MGFSRQEYWSGLPFPSPEDLSASGIESRSPELQEDSLWSEPPGKGKASGGNGIPAELFQILKDDAGKVLHSIRQQTWKTQQWPQDWKRSVFIPVPKKGNSKECSKYCRIALISYSSKVILKILQASLPQYMNSELPNVPNNFQMFRTLLNPEAGFKKGRKTGEQIGNIHWVRKSKRTPK